MAEFEIKDLEWVLTGPAFSFERHHAHARKMRGEEDPEWVLNFVSAYHNQEDPTLNKQTGKKHTIESMVEDLKKRVQLDAIEKTAASQSNSKPPLFVKAQDAAQQVIDIMKDYVIRHHVKPAHGQASVQALFEAIKDEFGVDAVKNVGGSEVVLQMLEKIKDEYEVPNPALDLPKYDGTPFPASKENEMREKSDFLFGGAPENR